MPRLVRLAAEESGMGPDEVPSTGVDTIGDVAIVRLGPMGTGAKRRFAANLMEEMRNVRCVFEQVGKVEGDLRLRRLRHLAGEKRTLTFHRENGCIFKVDVAKCYFSPRLSTERLRVAEAVSPGERVLNMFAGVGPFSVPVAKKKRARVTSNELNEYACELHEENNGLNHVEKLIDVVRGDAANLPKVSRRKYDRILMPHPSQADKFLATALSMSKAGTVIHYYRHVLGRDEDEAAKNLGSELQRVLPKSWKFGIRRVREVGPRWLEMVADVRVGN